MRLVVVVGGNVDYVMHKRRGYEEERQLGGYAVAYERSERDVGNCTGIAGLSDGLVEGLGANHNNAPQKLVDDVFCLRVFKNARRATVSYQLVNLASRWP